MSPVNPVSLPEPGRSGRSGREGWWRTLEEQAQSPAFEERLYNEFPSQIEEMTDPVKRRAFLKLMGASLALAGVTACTRQPTETIVPYVRQPEDMVPGRPQMFATAMTLGGIATGLLVESHEGRPTKIEGNPQHPGSLGASDVFAQAAILGLYDPDRSQTLLSLGEIRPWPRFLGAIGAILAAQQPLQGRGLRILTESVSSPTLAAQIRDLLRRYPSARWHQWDPASADNARGGAKLAFGDYVSLQYRFDRADVVRRARRRLPDIGSRQPPLRARFCGAAAARSGGDHEPAVRHRNDADRDGLARGSSAPCETERDRIDRPSDSRVRLASRAPARRRRPSRFPKSPAASLMPSRRTCSPIAAEVS